MSEKLIAVESIVGGFVASGIMVAFSVENAAFLPVWAKILIHAILVGVMSFELLFPFSKKEDEYFVENRSQIKKAIGASGVAAFGCSAAILYILYDQEALSVWIKAIMFGVLIGFYFYQMLTMFSNADVNKDQIINSLTEKEKSSHERK